MVIPQWLQTYQGYPAMLSGFIVSCTAIAAITTSQISGKALARGVDPRLLVSMAVGWLGCMAIVRSNWTNEADIWTLVAPQVVQGFGMSFFMMPLTAISYANVPQHDIASATGLQNSVRTLFVGFMTAAALTIWDNTQQSARVEIAGKLQPGDTLEKLTQGGFSVEQARQVISTLVEKEAVMIAVDYVFVITAVIFFVGAAVVWLAPRHRPPGR